MLSMRVSRSARRSLKIANSSAVASICSFNVAPVGDASRSGAHGTGGSYPHRGIRSRNLAESLREHRRRLRFAAHEGLGGALWLFLFLLQIRSPLIPPFVPSDRYLVTFVTDAVGFPLRVGNVVIVPGIPASEHRDQFAVRRETPLATLPAIEPRGVLTELFRVENQILLLSLVLLLFFFRTVSEPERSSI